MSTHSNVTWSLACRALTCYWVVLKRVLRLSLQQITLVKSLEVWWMEVCVSSDLFCNPFVDVLLIRAPQLCCPWYGLECEFAVCVWYVCCLCFTWQQSGTMLWLRLLFGNAPCSPAQCHQMKMTEQKHALASLLLSASFLLFLVKREHFLTQHVVSGERCQQIPD